MSIRPYCILSSARLTGSYKRFVFLLVSIFFPLSSLTAQTIEEFKNSKEYQEYEAFSDFKDSEEYERFLESKRSKNNKILSPQRSDVASSPDTGSIEYLFNLELSELLTVPVSIASKTPESVLKTAGTVYIITEEEIARYGWRDLREILAAVPALSTRRTFDWFQVSLRGGGANMLKLLIDGREVQNLIADEALIQDSFPSHRISRVEILMGSHSTLYGSNSADGVINIITKYGSEQQTERAEVQVIQGEANTSLISVVARNNFDKGHMGITASTFESHYNWQELTDFAQDNEAWSRRNTDNLPDYSDPVSAPYRSYSLGLYSEYNDTYFGANIWEDSSPQGYQEVFSYWGERRSIRKFDQWFIGQNYTFGEFDGSVEYIYTNEEDLFLEPDWNGSLEPTRHHVKAEANTTIDDHKVVFGYDGYTQKNIFRNDVGQIGSSGIVRLFPASKIHDIETRKHSLFIHDSFNIDENLNTVVGLRYEAYKDVENTIIPRVGLVYSPYEQASFRFIYGGGFRAPNGFDIVRSENAGNDTLDPIKSDMFEVGYIQSAGGDNWSLINNFSVYKYEIDGDYVTTLVGGGGGTGNFILEPDDSSSSLGVENMLNFEYKKFKGFISARYSNPDKTQTAGERITKDVPKYKAKLGLSYRFYEGVTASMFVDHWSKVKTEANLIDVDGSEVENISEWTRIDLNLVFGDYKWGKSKMKLTLQGENITDEEYYHSLPSSTPYQVLQPPRTFRISADVEY